MTNTENKRRSAGCHMVLTVPPLLNVGVTEPDRPHLAWVYRGFAEEHPESNVINVLEFLQAKANVMESLLATVLVLESLSAEAEVQEALQADGTVIEALSATATTTEALSASVGVNP